MIPLSQLKFFLDKPDNAVDIIDVHKHALQTDYTMRHQYIVTSPTHLGVVRKDLTRALSSLTMEIAEELGAGFDRFWGSNTDEWREVILGETMMNIAARASNRMLVGLPLCTPLQDPVYERTFT